MAKSRTIGNVIAPPRFLAFIVVLIFSVPAAAELLHDRALGAMAGFDLAAVLFLAISVPLLQVKDASVIRSHAAENDANRTFLLVLTGIVMAVLLIAVAAEAVGRSPQPFTKVLIIVTLVLAWVFSNTIYAFHYAHLAYVHPTKGCAGLEFPSTPQPVYWDFIYFAFTLGMTFQTSDVTIVDRRIRRVATVHCLAAFFFNIGVLAFTINVLGSA